MTQKTTAKSVATIPGLLYLRVSWYLEGLPALYHSTFCKGNIKKIAFWSVSMLFLTVQTRPPEGLKAQPEEGRLCLTWDPPF